MGFSPTQPLGEVQYEVRSFAIELDKCSSCGGRMKLRALVTKPASVRRLLRHLGEPTEAPPLSPARDPPSYVSQVLRRRSYEPSPQGEMFVAP